MAIDESVRDELDRRLAAGDLDPDGHAAAVAFLDRERVAFVDPAVRQRLDAQRDAGELSDADYREQLAAAQEMVPVDVDADQKRLLDMRFARGEIGEDTYDDILCALIDSDRDAAEDAAAEPVAAPNTAAKRAAAARATNRNPARRFGWRKTLAIAATVVAIVVVAGLLGQNAPPSEKPVLPVGLTARQSLMGTADGGWVMQFRNQLDKDLQLYIVIKDGSGRRSKDGNLFLAKYETKEIGWMEGWQFRGGESIEIQHPDYKVATWTFK